MEPAPGRPCLACIVADLGQARLALREAAAAGAALELWSPPDAAASPGVGFWAALDRAVAELAAAEFAAAGPTPAGGAMTVLDCGAAPGFALAALREGLCHLHVEVRADVRARLGRHCPGLRRPAASRPAAGTGSAQPARPGGLVPFRPARRHPSPRALIPPVESAGRLV